LNEFCSSVSSIEVQENFDYNSTSQHQNQVSTNLSEALEINPVELDSSKNQEIALEDSLEAYQNDKIKLVNSVDKIEISDLSYRDKILAYNDSITNENPQIACSQQLKSPTNVPSNENTKSSKENESGEVKESSPPTLHSKEFKIVATKSNPKNEEENKQLIETKPYLSHESMLSLKRKEESKKNIFDREFDQEDKTKTQHSASLSGSNTSFSIIQGPENAKKIVLESIQTSEKTLQKAKTDLTLTVSDKGDPMSYYQQGLYPPKSKIVLEENAEEKINLLEQNLSQDLDEKCLDNSKTSKEDPTIANLEQFPQQKQNNIAVQNLFKIIKKAKCRKCKERLENIAAYKFHMHRHWFVDQACPICDMKNSSLNFTNHLLEHMGENPTPSCQSCPRLRFQSKAHLDLHLDWHQRQRDLKSRSATQDSRSIVKKQLFKSHNVNTYSLNNSGIFTDGVSSKHPVKSQLQEKPGKCNTTAKKCSEFNLTEAIGQKVSVEQEIENKLTKVETNSVKSVSDDSMTNKKESKVISNIRDFKPIFESNIFNDVESKKEPFRKTDFRGITLIQAEMDKFEEEKVELIPKKTKMISPFESKAKVSDKAMKKVPFAQVALQKKDAIKNEDKLEPEQTLKSSIIKWCEKRKSTNQQSSDKETKLVKMTSKVEATNDQRESYEKKTCSVKPDLQPKTKNISKQNKKKKESPSDYSKENKENKISTNNMVWPIDCPKCHRRIVSLENFGNHLRQHWWINKCCALCGKRVNSKFDDHLRSHTGAS